MQEQVDDKKWLVKFLKESGLQRDYREGNLQLYQRLHNLYQDAHSKGFCPTKKSFTEQDLEQYITGFLALDPLLLGRDLQFEANTSDETICQYTNCILDTLIADIMAKFTFVFPIGDLEFTKSMYVLPRVQHIVNLVLGIVVENLQFYLKFEFNIVMISIDDPQDQRVKVYSFPEDHSLLIKNKNFTLLFESLKGMFDKLEQLPDDTKWRVHEIQSMTLKITKSYFGGCVGYKLSEKSRCLIQPDSVDNLCFWRCLAICIFREKIPNITKRHSKEQREKAKELQRQYYDQIGQLTYEDIVRFDQIPNIAEVLRLNLHIYTLDKEDGKLKAKSLWQSELHQNQLIMLHYDSIKNHFIVINTLVGYGEVIYCPKCGKVFDYSKATRYHKHVAKHQPPIKQLTFKKKQVIPKVPLFEQLFGIPLVRDLYFGFDFEVLLLPSQFAFGSNQQLVNIHQPIAFVLHCSDPKYPPVQYCGINAAKVFIQHLDDLHDKVVEDLQLKFKHAYKTQINDLYKKLCTCVNKKQHQPGCKAQVIMCKLYKEYLQIPIIGFNSGKYDMTFVISHMLKYDIANLITKSGSYMKLMYGSWCFLDCRNYVPPGINLSRFAHMWGVSDQKEIMCYDWLDSIEKLDCPQLPPREAFHNKLHNQECNKSDYLQAQQNWIKWKCSSIKDYIMNYCRIDVEIMMMALKNYRQVYLEENKIELLNHVSLPQTAYTTFLKCYHSATLYPLYTITDCNSYYIISNSIFGGNCQVFNKHAKIGENNVTYLIGLDENNLYGWAGKRSLPYGNSTFINDKMLCNDLCTKFNRVSSEQRQLPVSEKYSSKLLHSDEVADPYEFTGFIRCSLYFTKEQKEKLKHFPPIPNKIKVGTGKKKQTKLVYSLFDIDDYCIFSEFLKQLLENDWCTLYTIYEVVQMSIGPLMRSFIDVKTAKRQEAEDIIRQYENATPVNDRQADEINAILSSARAKKDVAKLDNNSCYGKTIQSDEHYDTSLIVKNKTQFLQKTVGKVIADFNALSPPAADNSHHGSVEVKLKKTKVEIRSPKYLGAAILAYSKMLMLDFVYNCLAVTFQPEEYDILYTDTDSVYIAKSHQ